MGVINITIIAFIAHRYQSDLIQHDCDQLQEMDRILSRPNLLQHHISIFNERLFQQTMSRYMIRHSHNHRASPQVVTIIHGQIFHADS